MVSESNATENSGLFRELRWIYVEYEYHREWERERAEQRESKDGKMIRKINQKQKPLKLKIKTLGRWLKYEYLSEWDRHSYKQYMGLFSVECTESTLVNWIRSVAKIN